MNQSDVWTSSKPSCRRRSGWLLAWHLVVFCTGLVLTGCYDSQALIDAHKAEVERTRLVEVELGDYRVTLPKPYRELERAEVFFAAFGYVPQSDVESVQQQLAEHQAELDHRVMIAIRRLKMEEIAEPTLQTLREEIHRAVNETVASTSLQAVGFRKFGFSNY